MSRVCSEQCEDPQESVEELRRSEQTIALFERRSAKYVLINGGYMTVAFVVMGLILGAWR